MLNKKIAIIGVGTMGWAIAQKLLEKDVIAAKNLFLSDRSLSTTTLQKLNLPTIENNVIAVVHADIVILAVKPQNFPEVLDEICPYIHEDTLIISIAAGVTIDTIQSHFDKKQPIIRVMPNLATTVGESVSCWIAGKEVKLPQILQMKEILNSFGNEVELLDEKDMDKVTAISGSGPAYFFYLAALMEEAARKLELDPEMAKKLVIQTMRGSAQLYVSRGDALSLLDQVTSKKGTTDAALSVLDKKKVHKTFVKAIEAAYKRAKELS